MAKLQIYPYLPIRPNLCCHITTGQSGRNNFLREFECDLQFANNFLLLNFQSLTCRNVYHDWLLFYCNHVSVRVWYLIDYFLMIELLRKIAPSQLDVVSVSCCPWLVRKSIISVTSLLSSQRFSCSLVCSLRYLNIYKFILCRSRILLITQMNFYYLF